MYFIFFYKIKEFLPIFVKQIIYFDQSYIDSLQIMSPLH